MTKILGYPVASRVFRTFVTGPGAVVRLRRRPLLEHGRRHDARRGDGDGARAHFPGRTPRDFPGGSGAVAQLDAAAGVRAHDAGGARGRGERPLATHSCAGGKMHTLRLSCFMFSRIIMGKSLLKEHMDSDVRM